MKVSVLIDNYNYEKFLPECIQSVLDQTYQNFEIVIVDDGSSDNSREIIERYAKKDERIKPVFKPNGGQASAFNEGIKRCTGDIVCFLDSDDKFKKRKLEKVVQVYEKGFEYIVHDYEIIGNKNYKGPYYPYAGYNLFLVYYMTYFTGSTTSNISVSRRLAEKIFPIEDEKFFRVRADDVVVFSASMMEEMFFIEEELTEYRIHGNNLFAGNWTETRSDKYERDLVLHRLKKRVLEKMGIDRRFLENPFILYKEFTTKRIIDREIFKRYAKILFLEMNVPFLKKLIVFKSMFDFYLKNRGESVKKEVRF